LRIALGSIFRNSEHYVDRYAAQVEALRAAAPQHEFRCVLAEGDSTDGTYEALKAHFNGSVFKREHGGPVFGSVESVVRFRQMSWVQDGVLEKILPDDDVLIYVEADLIWQPETMIKLLEHLKKPGVDLVSPMCWYQNRNYDWWAFRGLDGVYLGPYPPFHISLLQESPNGLYPLSSSGSCIAMLGNVARNCRFDPPQQAIVGFSWNATSKGYKIWLDPKLRVHHP
jgi:glycosyltransferase involved in cell wall biosynthesis